MLEIVRKRLVYLLISEKVGLDIRSLTRNENAVKNEFGRRSYLIFIWQELVRLGIQTSQSTRQTQNPRRSFKARL
jgi:hypothetical protein